MAKYAGYVGYAELQKTAPGVFKEVITERRYFGDVIENVRRYEPSSYLNDNLQIQNQVSIVADAYAYQNFHAIRYCWFMGAKWKVRSVQVERPRLVLSLGDVYNDQTETGSATDPGGYPGGSVGC